MSEFGQTRGQISEKALSLVGEYFGLSRDEQPAENSHFVDDLGADSLDFLEVIMMFEEEFDIEINDDEAETVQTVGDAIDLIDRKING